MITSILITDNVKQIILTPETASDKEVVKILKAEKQSAVVEIGSFIDESYYGYGRYRGIEIYECQGGYSRCKESSDSIMFVIKSPKEAQD